MFTSKTLKFIRKFLYFALPVIIIYIIFHSIDTGQFLAALRRTDPMFLVIGMAPAPFMVFVAALRWSALEQAALKQVLGASFFLRHYWVGQALSLLLPGYLGTDAYRIVAATNRFGKVLPHIIVVVFEKALALISCIALVMLIYPLLPDTEVPAIMMFYMDWLYILVLLGIVIVGALWAWFYLSGNGSAGVWLFQPLWRLVRGFLRRIADAAGVTLVSKGISKQIWLLARPASIAIPLGYSFVLHIVGAIMAQFFFLAISYDVSFLANLFAVPILFLLGQMPISFAGAGVREVGHIFVYGLFGVPAETALLVSFFVFAAMLLNNGIGGLVIIGSKSAFDLN